MNRKDFLLGAGMLALSTKTIAKNIVLPTPEPLAKGPYTLAALPYATDALEPHIDKQTMEIHHGKHHAAYVNNLNNAVDGLTVPEDARTLISDLQALPEGKRNAVRNNGGGHVNHTMFWNSMSQKSSAEPVGALAKAIEKEMGSYANFKERFSSAALTRFGSGWAWLYVQDKKLFVGTTANQDNPLMGERIAGIAGTPILGLDVWEHAYYLKYQNKRSDYIAAWFNVVNWNVLDELYQKAMM